MIIELQDLMETHYVGKRFVYESKYGGYAFGVVKSIDVSSTFRFDDEYNTVINSLAKENVNPRMLNKEPNDLHKFLARKQNPDIKPTWFGSRPTIRIKSENNISYDLSEIYILSE